MSFKSLLIVSELLLIGSNKDEGLREKNWAILMHREGEKENK